MKKNITSEFWDYVEQDKTKTGKKVYNWLNYDYLSEVILEDDCFWYETNQSIDVPNYIHDYIKNWGIKQGYRYLWDIALKY